MPLEATVIVVDNSEYMRNGDYHPDRYHAQADAVTTLFQTKVDSNPENTVGFMTMAGKGPEVLQTNTKELGSILAAIHTAESKLGGLSNVPNAIEKALLALKHRSNKNLRQRIVVFLGSPLEGQAADEKFMVRLAKRLKKNNVAVDIIAFGDGIEEGEATIMKTFVDSVTSGDNCHYLSVPPGAHLLSDMVLTSPVLASDRGVVEENMGVGAPGPAAGGSGGGFEFGVDPSLDPELAMALRMSMEEEQARQAAVAQTSSASAPAPPAAPVASTPTPAVRAAPVPAAAAPAADDDEEDEDAMLARALAMSQGGDVEMAEGDEENEEDEIQKAIQQSLQDQQRK
ncbi:uncharacterized protein BXZ73DRAFT_45114 [Epithele typhae]|uniref:uncharacterized protein n=1 Tax=Epithele typhae TaxID=378194 RepID=UPI002008E6DB|nr:uncharacterized protein BXZ73DRAFT_45114 [Epithele typhae]KAH9936889.1 hypothetical protein BXZ73DRAFT_45114 [Epithele typhae]